LQRIFKTRTFMRFARGQGISDVSFSEAVKRAERSSLMPRNLRKLHLLAGLLDTGQGLVQLVHTRKTVREGGSPE